MTTNKLRVFIDSDVLFAASASGLESAASVVVMTLGEITLLDLVVSQQVIDEVTRNLTKKVPQALLTFQFLCHRSVTIVENPSRSNIERYQGQADPKDLPILVAAIEQGCDWLLTFNTRHFHPEENRPIIHPPGNFIQAFRQHLTELNRRPPT